MRRGSGPETIDIKSLERSDKPTRYLYGIHNALQHPIKSPYGLGAQVCVYTSIGEIAHCYTAPPGNQEFWFVFEMDQEGNIFGRECLANGLPEIGEDENGYRVVGISFPSCSGP